MGDWKAIATGQTGPWELYNLSNDRCEQKDLAAAEPDRLNKLAATWKQHDEEYVRVRESSPPSSKEKIT